MSRIEQENEELKRHIAKIRKTEKSPESPYSHSYLMLEDGRKVTPGDIIKLVDRNIKLANIDNDEYMRVVQMWLGNLAHLARMAEVTHDLIPAFVFEYSTFRAEMEITRAYKGRERRSQNSLSPDTYEGGYGSRLSDFGDSEGFSDEKKPMNLPNIKLPPGNPRAFGNF